jgi:hypothetical protein
VIINDAQFEDDNTVKLITVDGILGVKDQMKEYVDCGPGLMESNFLDFFLNMYEGNQANELTSTTGRTYNKRVPYQEGTGHR